MKKYFFLFLSLLFIQQSKAHSDEQKLWAYIYTIPFDLTSYGTIGESSFYETTFYKKLSKKKTRYLLNAVGKCDSIDTHCPIDLRVLIKFKNKEKETVYQVGFDKWGFVKIGDKCFCPEKDINTILSDYIKFVPSYR